MNIWRHWKDPDNANWGYTWCAPCPDMEELERTLRWGEPTRQQILAAASVMACYATLVEMSERDRRKVLREIRKGPSPLKVIEASPIPPDAVRPTT